MLVVLISGLLVEHLKIVREAVQPGKEDNKGVEPLVVLPEDVVVVVVLPAIQPLLEVVVVVVVEVAVVVLPTNGISQLPTHTSK